jgi:hypothetical protein
LSPKAGDSRILAEFLLKMDQKIPIGKSDDFVYFYPIECDFLDIIVIEKSSAHDEMIVG